MLGLEVGEAAVIRNAGGRVTPAVLEDLAYLAFLSQELFGDQLGPAGRSLFEVAVIHHQCGTGFLADRDFRNRASQSTGVPEDRLLSTLVDDPERTVRDDVARLLASPLIPAGVPVSGHVYDVATGRLSTVCDAEGRYAHVSR